MTQAKQVYAAIEAMPGAEHHALAAATGLKEKATQRALETLKAGNKVAALKLGRINYFFADQLALGIGRDEIINRYERERAEAKRATAAKDAARAIKRYHGDKVLSGLPTGPKPIKLLQPKPVNTEKAARKKFADQVALNPSNVKPINCPGFTGAHRYQAEPGCYGAGFSEEWRRLRA